MFILEYVAGCFFNLREIQRAGIMSTRKKKHWTFFTEQGPNFKITAWNVNYEVALLFCRVRRSCYIEPMEGLILGSLLCKNMDISSRIFLI